MRLVVLSILTYVMSTTYLYAQNKVDITLDAKSSNAEISCFDINIRSAEARGVALAGQNYRLFYDALKLKVRKQDIMTQLDRTAYSALDFIVQEEGSIGFLSISVDGRNLTSETVQLSAEREWHNIASVCFDRLSERDYDLIWADESTESFASAHVAASEWESDDIQVALGVNLLKGYSSIETAETQWDVDIKIYPNPVEDHLNVSIPALDHDGAIAIRDAIGREIVYESLRKGNEKELSYDLSNWPSGRYVVELISDKTVVYSRGVIKIETNR